MPWEKKKHRTVCPSPRWPISSWKNSCLSLVWKIFPFLFTLGASLDSRNYPDEASSPKTWKKCLKKLIMLLSKSPGTYHQPLLRCKQESTSLRKMVYKRGNNLILLHHKRIKGFSFPLLLCSADWPRTTLFWSLKTTLHPKNVLPASRCSAPVL